MTITNDTRRSFLQHIARLSAVTGLGAIPTLGDEPQNCAGPRPPTNPVRWTPDTSPILPRFPAWTLNAASVTKLRNAYAALRNLTTTQPNDPRGWLQQGNKHCWNCGGGLDGQAGEEIHGSWLFLPWHRAFLYFHERILGALINDNSLRLAYWDWDNAAHRALPPAWVTPNSSSNSLWDANRAAVAGNQLLDWLVGPTIMNPILGAPTFAQFGGSGSNPGNLEDGPHGGVHIWCGDTTLQSQSADMGLLDTAAQDPIFFAHHANIDRLWNVWLSSSPSHTNPTDVSWLNHRFTFWDEQKRWVYITVADVINMSNNLRYTYPTFVHPGPGLKNPKIVNLTLGPSRAIVLSPEVHKRVMAEAVANRPQLRTLRVEGVPLPPDAKGIYRIVANKPGAAAMEVVGTPNDLGYVAIVPRSSNDKGGHLHGTRNINLNVTGKLATLLQENGRLSLSYVPIAGNAKSTPLSYQRVYLVER